MQVDKTDPHRLVVSRDTATAYFYYQTQRIVASAEHADFVGLAVVIERLREEMP